MSHAQHCGHNPLTNLGLIRYGDVTEKVWQAYPTLETEGRLGANEARFLRGAIADAAYMSMNHYPETRSSTPSVCARILAGQPPRGAMCSSCS